MNKRIVKISSLLPTFVLWVLVLFLSIACNGVSCYSSVAGNEVEMTHSSLLTITDCEGYTVVDVKNPWGEGLLERYILVPKDTILPSNMPVGIIVRTPLEKAMIFSGVHASLFEELGVISSVSAVCDAGYIYSSAISDAIAEGRVIDCGSSLNVNMELLTQVSPDALFVLPYENGGYGKLDNSSYPLIECADYMENSSLGCAEWMRFYGRLMGCAEKSDSIFNVICEEYESLCEMVRMTPDSPKLMCELKSSSAWYVPAGESTMGRLYSDAGANYLFSSFGGSGSVPLSFEKVLLLAADADVWLFKYNSPVDMTYSSLLVDYAGYSHFKPFKERNIYACNTHRKRLFEQATFHPERLLKEFIVLFYPELIPEYKLRYYEKLREE